MADRQTFLTAIEAEPLDHELRCVFADWLEENGEVEEATRQREWFGAYEYLRKDFVYPCAEAEFQATYADDATYGELEDFAIRFAGTLRCAGVLREIKWWLGLLEEGGIYFASEDVVEYLYDEKHRNEFYRNIEIVTGVKILPETRERAWFRCSRDA